MGVHPPGVWIGFTALVLGLLVVDLGILNRRARVLSFREALTWSAGLVALALLFGVFLMWREGVHHALEYYSGYLVELSLSVDNLFVFILLFQYFAVPAEAQAKVLQWGILGAIVMRAIMIGLGAFALQRFEWIEIVFGGILLVTSVRMMRSGEERLEPGRNPIVRLARRLVPCTDCYDGARFITQDNGRRVLTPLLLVLIVIEWTDLVFAIDSIPAVFGVTRDPFLVYSSNIFAVIGLRALFFVLASLLDRFVYLKPGVAAILAFVGVKMLLSEWWHPPTWLSLAVIVGVLAVAIAASLVRVRRDARRAAVTGSKAPSAAPRAR
jgi:tellurite resistance protein TerC